MISPVQERRFLVLLFFIVGVPFALLTAFVTADTSVDLSDFHAKSVDGAGNRVVDWTVLSMSEPSNAQPPIDGAIISMAGYMMEPYQITTDRSRVASFTLMPEAGLIIHPAHRHPDQMVTVWISPNSYCAFHNRTLVLATGRFERLNSVDAYEALYAIRDAHVRPADPAELRFWFNR